ncbi:MAG TPA: M48 family metalloprotease, partial [Methanolinea sp.]|nr:M48 family metalloprotease [Methanolinea sp.]
MKVWKRDLGLTMRIWLTMFLLFLVYLVFLAVLSMLGVGLPFLVILVFGMAFVQYFFSDKLVLWSTRARVIERDENPQLFAMVEKLANEAGLPMPRVAIMPSPVPNAFATGRSPRHAVVAVTDSI